MGINKSPVPQQQPSYCEQIIIDSSLVWVVSLANYVLLDFVA